MGGIGPVEPGLGTEPTELVTGQARRDGGAWPVVRGWWVGLSAWGRRGWVAAVLAVALVAAGVAVWVVRPGPVEEPLVPYPLHLVSVVYGGVVVPVGGGAGGADAGGGGGRFAFSVTFRALPGSSVVVEDVRQPSEGLSLALEARTPFVLNPDSPREVRIAMRVRDCDIAPRNVRLPFLKVTLRNVRAVQTHSFILGSAYANDLAEAVSRACPDGARG